MFWYRSRPTGVGGGPTPDKPTVTLSVPDPDHINSFMNFRVADIQACYQEWKNRGAEFITEPLDQYGEWRCYIRDSDGYPIEVGQSKLDFSTVDGRFAACPFLSSPRPVVAFHGNWGSSTVSPGGGDGLSAAGPLSSEWHHI